MEVQDLPALNAGLNALATVLLLVGRQRIRRGREGQHKALMLSAFACSVLFLASYLAYHLRIGGGVRFHGEGLARGLYLAFLASHVLLAAVVPFLALRVIQLGLRGERARHRRLARLAWPLWVYVGLSGILIYFLLYHLTDSAARAGLAAG